MKKIVLLIIIFLLSFCIGCIDESSKIRKYPLLDNKNEPTIDFLQPWAFYDKKVEELDEHFEELKARGYDTIIIQNIAKYYNGEPKECFYDSKRSFPLEKRDFLNNIISVCGSKNIKVICGISSDNYWWKENVHKFSDETMEVFNDEERFTIGEILSKYKVDGIYYSNEMYSSKKDFLPNWAKNINAIIDYIEKYNSNIPLYLSPYNSSYYGGSDNKKLSFWKEFFKEIKFRDFDYFLLQDGFGGLDKNLEESECEEVYNLNKKIRSLCLEYSEVNFALNIELFASHGLASDERVILQKKYANTLGNVIASFSVSHYYIEGDKHEE